jgi:sortase A
MSTSSYGVVGKVHGLDEDDEPGPERKPRLQWVWWVVALLLVFALYQFSSAGWIYARATVAQHLIARSWESARQAGAAERPWPWADTRAVARLSVPARGVDLFVLDGTSNKALSYGPGHVSGTAQPGAAGNSVILAHRDTHFAFLRHLELDEEIDVETPSGKLARYRVREVSVVDKGDTRVMDAADSPQLTLITCYPFDAIEPGTTLRYVVVADRVGAQGEPGAKRKAAEKVVGVRGFEPPASTSRT